MKQPEHEDPVWNLLEHATRAEPGPYFTRRVMREIREISESGSRGWFSRFLKAISPKVALPALAAVAALAIVAVFQSGPTVEVRPAVNPALVLQIGDSPVDPEVEMAAVEYLGQLMAVADPGQLSDEALADLFF